ncbi:MAG: hypothetical protein ABI308_07635 [Mucilaginibacter sp.]
MKKLKLQLDGVKQMLSKDQMKKVIGGDYGGGSGGTCHFHCCTDQHTNCNDYVDSGYSCSSASDCNGSQASCSGGGHLYWSCF